MTGEAWAHRGVQCDADGAGRPLMAIGKPAPALQQYRHSAVTAGSAHVGPADKEEQT